MSKKMFILLVLSCIGGKSAIGAGENSPYHNNNAGASASNDSLSSNEKKELSDLYYNLFSDPEYFCKEFNDNILPKMRGINSNKCSAAIIRAKNLTADGHRASYENLAFNGAYYVYNSITVSCGTTLLH